MNDLGALYYMGDLVEQDYAQAAVASPEAQWKLANLKKMKR